MRFAQNLVDYEKYVQESTVKPVDDDLPSVPDQIAELDAQAERNKDFLRNMIIRIIAAPVIFIIALLGALYFWLPVCALFTTAGPAEAYYQITTDPGDSYMAVAIWHTDGSSPNTLAFTKTRLGYIYYDGEDFTKSAFLPADKFVIPGDCGFMGDNSCLIVEREGELIVSFDRPVVLLPVSPIDIYLFRMLGYN